MTQTTEKNPLPLGTRSPLSSWPPWPDMDAQQRVPTPGAGPLSGPRISLSLQSPVQCSVPGSPPPWSAASPSPPSSGWPGRSPGRSGIWVSSYTPHTISYPGLQSQPFPGVFAASETIDFKGFSYTQSAPHAEGPLDSGHFPL